MRLQSVRLARPDLLIPMPDRAMRLCGETETVDAESPFYARLIADGDLVVIESEPTTDSGPATPARTSKRS